MNERVVVERKTILYYYEKKVKMKVLTLKKLVIAVVAVAYI